MNQETSSSSHSPGEGSERLDQLRKAIADGLESGPAEPWDPEEIKRAGRARMKTADKKPPGADGQ
jgi:Arc/MetJ-type ribon-helix-helix transcriptional regulator